MTADRSAASRRSFLRQLSALGFAWTSRRSLYAQAAMQPMQQGPPPPIPMTMPMGPAGPARHTPPQLPPMLRPASLRPFVDRLPLPPRAVPQGGKLRIAMREVHAPLHRDLPPARHWSYGETPLAPLIEARSGQALRIEWVNQLPAQHMFAIDHSLHGCGPGVPDVRACVHLHGGRTPSASDGQPDDWYVPGKSRVCTYPLQQDAATLWYHDHAMGINRLNMYAGLFGMFNVRDPAEDALGLPGGAHEIPLLLCDRMVTAEGQLYYPTSGDPKHPWVSEFGGDALLVNGKLFPFVEVEPRLYRIRVLNAANSRFFNLSLSGNQTFHQIGTDQGLLAAPVKLNRLMLAPAERADLLIDFSGAAGQNVHLVTGATSLLQFRVGRAPATQTPELPAALRPFVPLAESSATVTRAIGLYEYLDVNANTMLMLINQKRWHEPVTETPKLNTTEIWEFVNLTEDTHPMHLHLVRFQVLDRRVLDVFAYRNNKGFRFIGDTLPPEANERGWKDTVQCPPGMVTRVLVPFDGYAGKYLYHCHILEHEANDMMRPFEVLA